MVRPGSRLRGRFPVTERGRSPVVGVALMVAITVVLAAVVVAMLTGTADPGVAPTTDTAVSLQPTNAGTELTTEYSGGQVFDVRLNGETIETLDGDAVGSTVFLPTAPGDEVHLVAAEDDSEMLLRETFDAGEAGDFVAYYTFDGGGGTLLDHSQNGNDGTLVNGPAWTSDDQGSALEFDGTNDRYVQVDDLNTAGTGDVDAFTIVATFQVDNTGQIQQLVQHDSGGEQWHVETTGDGNLRFAVNYPAGETVETTSDPLTPGETYVVAGTYDENEYHLYLDGAHVAGGSYASDVDMGDMRLGQDDSGVNQELEGRLYEFRLYYTALDDHRVGMLTEVID